MIYIEECKRKYVEFFPVDWIEKLEWKDRDTSLASYKKDFLESITLKFYVLNF